ncbi:MAG: hypothetical protein IPG04_25270 [Polyangiaceae bacterium]|nr:hypothetical protein [Polyangiaceae bacterium]
MTILGHPEYGATLTDATGRYILAVNASHRLTLDLQAAGFIRAARRRGADAASRARGPK